MATTVAAPPAAAAAAAPPAQAPSPAPEVQPNQTIYINNLNEKIKRDELVNSLRAMFSQFGNILDIIACKTLKLKGQAWVVFDNVASATKAKDGMQDFPFHDKPLRIQYAKTKSDAVAKLDGTFMPKEKRKKMDERGQRKREHHDQHSYYNHQYHAPRPSLPEAPAPPNNILFVQKLPHDMTSHTLQAYFERIPGFKEVRMIEAKPGIAFVEYIDENHATVAKNTFNGYRINDCPMHITYAKR